jgi:D-alanyl-D-alanine carboxypeptidase/D-alanyl-D-alanine-endopeptidase (penicillin-binding protein 4)
MSPVPARRTAAALGLVLVATTLTVAPASADQTPAPTAATTARAALTPAAVAANARIARVLPKRVKKAKPLGRNRAIQAVDLGTGIQLFGRRTTVPLRGASVTKLATAVNALSLFGTTTRFPTRVVDGTSSKQIILVGGGDPLLSSLQLRALALRTATALATRVPPVTPPPPPPVGEVDPTPTPTPTPTTVSFRIRVDDTLYGTPTGAPGWWTSYQPYVVTPVRPLVRDLRNGWDTSADAAKYFAGRVQIELAKLLAERTDLVVDVKYSGRLAAAPDAPEVARFKGNTTGAALAWMLKVSDNDVAEMFFRNNAIALKATPSWAGARAAAQAHLASLGVDVRGWQLVDGSGVSRKDRLTTRGLIQLLTLAESPAHPELAPLRGMLPVGGKTGTLAASNGRYTTAPTRCARGKVFAKTGTLHDTVGLAGYARGSDGRLRAFAVMVNSRNTRYSKLTVRRAVDRIPTTLTGCW